MNKENITFDSMPEAISYLIAVVDNLASAIALLINAPSTDAETSGDAWFTVEQLCEYLPEHPAKQTVYQWVYQRQIPAHKNTKRLIFLKSEIDAWLAGGVHKTYSQLEAEAQAFISDKFKQV